MHSAIYQGWVRHRRYRPITHSFRYRLFMMYLDLDEIDRVFQHRMLWSSRRAAVARFRRRDHLGDPQIPLTDAVRDVVEQHSGRRPGGPIRLLTHLRYFGYGFNPISLYYCYHEDAKTLHSVVAEVNNTPWGEQHPYVLLCDHEDGNGYRCHAGKAMHVSPFMSLAMRYRFRLTAPGQHLVMHIENRTGAGDEPHDDNNDLPLFDATLVLNRREISGISLAGVLVRYPLMTWKVIATIHYQAVKLWWQGCPVFPHSSQSEPKANSDLNKERAFIDE